MGWLHRQIWQRLPRRFRRKLLFSLAAIFAPRRDRRPAQTIGPIYVAGPLRTASGLGQWSRLSLEALRAAGHDARGIDLSLAHDPKRRDFSFAEADDASGPGIILLHANGFLTSFALHQLGRRTVSGKTIIGYWAWELPDLPREWWPGLKFIHEVWGCSRFTAEAIKRRTDLPVRALLPPLAPIAETPTFDASASLVVLTAFDMASSFARKNPMAAIAAFRTAFGDDPGWSMIVKVSDAETYPEGLRQLQDAAARYGNVTLVSEVLSRRAMTDMVADAAIILSLHRSEGVGLVLAEAMSAGKVVVATNWSGNTDFMTTENSCPVDYQLVPARDPQGTYDHPEMLWAEPDIGHAAEQLGRLKDPETRVRLGRQAMQDAARLFSPAAYAEKLSAMLGLSPPKLKLDVE